MWPGNGYISAFPEPNYVILKPVEMQEQVLYLVMLYLSEIFTHNWAADQSFKELVATTATTNQDQPWAVAVVVAENWGVQKTGHSPIASKKGKKLDWTRLLNIRDSDYGEELSNEKSRKRSETISESWNSAAAQLHSSYGI